MQAVVEATVGLVAYAPAPLASVALGEMHDRMRGIRRDCMWSETGLTEAENRVLEPLWEAMG